MEFRLDINGLRAIAVMAVVLFHFIPDSFPGGFIGVDVFFVISGYLMTGIIFRGIENNSFSLLRFYLARAKRIVPALSVLCLALLVFGWFYLGPNDYKLLGKHAASSISFLSNFTYKQEAGYFDALSHEKWLLHTWSLSVEWQFYLLYPVVLLILRRFVSLSSIKRLLLGCVVLGFAFCIFKTQQSPNSAYYLLHTRAWEMMMGGIAFLFPLQLNNANKKLFQFTGLILIVLSIFCLSKKVPWPGSFALLPVLGAFLVIQARTQNIVINNVICQKLGAWSYSIYLWHWPLVIAFHYFNFPEYVRYLLIMGSVFLGFMSFKFVEERFKGSLVQSSSAWKIKYSALTGVPILVLAISLYTMQSNGMSWHYKPELTIIDQEVGNINPERNKCHVSSGAVPECRYGTGKLAAIVIGDSHAASIVRSVEKSLNGKSVLDWTMSGCRTIEDVYYTRNNNPPDYSCGNFIRSRFDVLKGYVGVPIIIVNRYATLIYGPNEPGHEQERAIIEEFFQGEPKILERGVQYTEQGMNKMVNTVCKFARSNPVFILEPIPELGLNVPRNMSKTFLLEGSAARVKITREEYMSRNDAVFSMLNKLQAECGVKVIESSKSLCDENFCYGDANGRPMYFDSNHLSEFGAEKLIPEFKSKGIH